MQACGHLVHTQLPQWRAIRTEPIVLDIAVINALGQDRWRHTADRDLLPTSTAQLKTAGRRDTASGRDPGRHGQGGGSGHEGRRSAMLPRLTCQPRSSVK